MYCLRVLPKAAFNREHVLLEALGRFQGDHVTIDCVCQECNQYFGDTVDLLFARGSLEALLRFELGLKPTEEITQLRRDRLAFRYPTGSYRGMWLEPVPHEGQILCQPLPQAGFRLPGDAGWHYVPLRELSQLNSLPTGIDPKEPKRTIAMTQEDTDAVMAQLRRLGAGFTPQEDLPIPERWGETGVDVEAEVDMAVRRCVAKMAMNYLASIMGCSFMLGEGFDTLRHFIRDGTAPPYRIVTESQTPILADDEPLRRQTRGHLIVVQRDDQTDELVCLFAPFNEITYRIVLQRGSSGPWFRHGHLYDVDTREVTPLLGTSLLIP